MERRINLDNQDITMPLCNPIQVVNGKIPLETLTLVEWIKELEISFAKLATALKGLQSEFVALRTFIGFNE